MKKRMPDAILRPGAAGWELWKVPAKGVAVMESEVSPKALGTCRHLMLALPSRSILAVPLWIAAEGNAVELSELELTSRHLLRKGAEVYAFPLFHQDGRALVLALASVDDETAVEYLKKAGSFEFPARLLKPEGADILVWRELGELCFAIYREDKCVFFAATAETTAGPAFCAAVVRTAMRLHAEGVILRIPALLRLVGDFSILDGEAIGHALRLDLVPEPIVPPPEVPEVPSDPAPPTARHAMAQRDRFRRFGLVAIAVVAAYAVVLFLVAADLVWRRIELHRLGVELAAIEAPSADAQRLVTEWNGFREAVDPNMFALDQLAAAAAEIPGEQVRLTLYNYKKGRLTIAGEAVDVSQAYEFFERVKKTPLLQDYDWTSRQPQLAGRNKVRFEMEGARPDAQTGEE